jgi:hypothetical protein
MCAYQQCVCFTREIAHKPYEPRYGILAVLNRMAPPPKYNISLYHYFTMTQIALIRLVEPFACHFCARARSHEVAPMGFAQPGYYLNWFDRYLGTLFPSIEIQLWGLASIYFSFSLDVKDNLYLGIGRWPKCGDSSWLMVFKPFPGTRWLDRIPCAIFCAIKINSSVTRHAGPWRDEFERLSCVTLALDIFNFRHTRLNFSVRKVSNAIFLRLGCFPTIFLLVSWAPGFKFCK